MRSLFVLVFLSFVACKNNDDKKDVVKSTRYDNPYQNNPYQNNPYGPQYPPSGYPNPNQNSDYSQYCIRINSTQSINAYNNSGTVFLSNVPMNSQVIPCSSFSALNQNFYVATSSMRDEIQLSLNLSGAYTGGGPISLSMVGNVDMRPTMYYYRGASTYNSLCRYGNTNFNYYQQNNFSGITTVYINGSLVSSGYQGSSNRFVGSLIACDSNGGSIQVDFSNSYYNM